MVNYCCVLGCGRNSRTNKRLNFYTLPKTERRQIKWLKLAGREEWLNQDMEKLRRKLRFCSRHFLPNHIKIKHLSEDALPIKSIPGSHSADESDGETVKHEGIVCDSCNDQIIGFRYKCVSCDNYDLCPKCEALETHPHHYMLRIPRPIKFFHDSGIELSEDDRNTIQREVLRAVQAAKEKNWDQLQNKLLSFETNKSTNTELFTVPDSTPELAFADVNDYREVGEVKNEVAPTTDIQPVTDQLQPMYYMKLSGDLSQLMIELTHNNAT
ncbi:sequestosome-1 [Danaus plexippus plexippus]|uniref:Sequestosome-1 n=1 Tax=Danaus plexippus plexippus TaxID=278856 RepID=A0A212F075_DANPL|nr:sequestosome-1 [Danaus plexippus plexippus]